MASILTKVSRRASFGKFVSIIAVCATIFYIIVWQLKDTSNKEKHQNQNTKHEEGGYGDNEDLERRLDEFDNWLTDLEIERLSPDSLDSAKCPACYGDDLCAEFANGNLRVDPNSQGQISRFGRWGDRLVVVREMYTVADYSTFEKYICMKVMYKEGCDVAKAVMSKQSFILREDAFFVSNIKRIRQEIGPAESKPSFRFPVCASNKLTAELSSSYDQDKDGALSAVESVQFWFTAVSNPEPMLLKFVADKFENSLPIAEYAGACGLFVVQDAVGGALTTFLDQGWEFRADLAYQLLEIIDNLLYGDLNWSIVWGNVAFDNFAVNSNGELMITNTEDILVVERQKTEEKKQDDVCNWEYCLLPYATAVITGSKDCTNAEFYGGHYMYLMACLMLTDNQVQRHRITELVDKIGAFKGILHSIPEEHKEKVTSLLDKCIVETKPRGRFDAVDNLKEFLSQFTEEYYEDYENDRPEI